MDSVPGLALGKGGKRKRKINTIIPMGLLILSALVLQQISWTSKTPIVSRNASILRTFSYFGLFIVWGLSIQYRIMQKQIRFYLQMIITILFLNLLVKYEINTIISTI